MKTTAHLRLPRRSVALGALLLFSALAADAATILVYSRDPAGYGFNDPTPVAPVGGNPGTTLGAQRANVYLHVAKIWGAVLQSKLPITVSAGWEKLTCSSELAILGSASPRNYWHNVPGGIPGTWYPQALANKLSGRNLSAYNPPWVRGHDRLDIKTQFNIALGSKGCLEGASFYLGLDGKVPAGQINFMTTLLHELGHGLGFTPNPTNSRTGQRTLANGRPTNTGGLPSIWEYYMLDTTRGKTWYQMTSAAQRSASAINSGNLTWIGPRTMAGFNDLVVSGLVAASPAESTPRGFPIGYAAFGPAVKLPMQLGDIVDTASTACTALESNSLAGKIAMVDRGGDCGFAAKAKVVQDAGAIGVVVIDNTAGDRPPAMGAGNTETDEQVQIPVVSVTLAGGTTLRKMVVDAAKLGPAGAPGKVTVSLGQTKRAIGADAGGRVLLYAPKEFMQGSSVAHFDTSATPNLLMEPMINGDLTQDLLPPNDLTLNLLKDLGW